MDQPGAALTPRARRWVLAGLLWAAPLSFLALFYAWPLVNIFAVSLWPGGTPDLRGFRELVSTPYLRRVVLFTVGQALLSTALVLLLAVPSAYVFVRYRFWGRGTLLALSALPFVLPTVVVAAAFTALLGTSGVLNSVLAALTGQPSGPLALERTLSMILLAHVFYNYAVALRMLVGYWATQSARMEDAARALGAHGWALWWRVRLPVLRPALLTAATLVGVFTFTSFGVVLLLGGVRFATIEVEIYRQVGSLLNLPLAAALSVVQLGAMLLLMVAYTRLQRRAPTDVQASARVARAPRTWPERALVAGTVLGVVVLLGAPLAALTWRAFVGGDGQLSLRAFAALTEVSRRSVLLAPPIVAVWNSVWIACVATALALVLGVLAAQGLAQPRSWVGALLDPLLMLPLATSAVTLGLGFLLALDRPPLNLRTSPALVPLAHTLVALPFVVRSVFPALRAVPPSAREAAAVLGARPWAVWRTVDLPLIRRGVLVGAAFAFTVSMGEFGATLFVARPELPTMPVVIFRLLGQPGALNVAMANAMAVLLLGVCALAFLAIERVRVGGMGEF